MKISEGEEVLFDDLVGTKYTYKNLKDWFPPPSIVSSINKKQKGGKNPQQKKPQIKKGNVNNPYTIIKNALKLYKEKYPLPSPMWKLQHNELRGIRIRFMKMLSFLLLNFQIMYENILNIHKSNLIIKNKNKKNMNTPDNLKTIHTMYSKLKKSIEMESDPDEKTRLIISLQELEATFGEILIN